MDRRYRHADFPDRNGVGLARPSASVVPSQRSEVKRKILADAIGIEDLGMAEVYLKDRKTIMVEV